MNKRKNKKKELRKKFEEIQGQEFVKGIQNYPDISLIDWVDIMIEYK